MKLFFLLLLCVPLLSFSQDTITFKEQNLTEFIIKSVPKKISEVSIINTIRRSSVISDGISISEGNKEVSYTKAEMEILSKPIWINGWTRFPNKGN